MAIKNKNLRLKIGFLYWMEQIGTYCVGIK